MLILTKSYVKNSKLRICECWNSHCEAHSVTHDSLHRCRVIEIILSAVYTLKYRNSMLDVCILTSPWSAEWKQFQDIKLLSKAGCGVYTDVIILDCGGVHVVRHTAIIVVGPSMATSFYKRDASGPVKSTFITLPIQRLAENEARYMCSLAVASDWLGLAAIRCILGSI